MIAPACLEKCENCVSNSLMCCDTGTSRTRRDTVNDSVLWFSRCRVVNGDLFDQDLGVERLED